MKKTSWFKKIIATVMAMATVLTFASCADTSWVASSSDDQISSGVYLGYLVDAYYTAATQATDQNKGLFEQNIGDVKAEDFIKQTALNSCKNHLVVTRLFNEYKLSFTDKELEEMNEEFDSYWSQLSSLYEENGCAKKSYLEILKVDEMRQKVFEFYYSEKGKETVSEKDRKEFFLKNYAKIHYVSVNYENHFSGVSSSSTASDAQKKELKEIAEKYVERLNKGEDIGKLVAEEEAAKLALTAKEGEKVEAPEVEKPEDTFIQKETSDDPSAFNKAVFDAKFKTPTMAENSIYGYYVFIRYEADADSKDYTDRAVSVLTAMKSTDFQEKVIDKAISELKLNENKSAIKRYKPQNIKL